MPNHGYPSIEEAIMHLRKSVNDLNENLVRQQQRKLPIMVNEYNADTNTSVTVPASSRGSVLIKTLVAQCTSNATITVGPHSIQITAAESPFVIGGLAWKLNQDSTRQITQQSVGFLSLDLSGEELGDVGVL